MPRPTSITVSSLTHSAWIPVNYRQNPFTLSLFVNITSGASLTYKVQHTADDPFNPVPVTISRTTTTATLTKVAHGLSVGDSVTVIDSGSTNLNGNYDVASVVDADNITYTVANTGATASIAGTKAVLLRVFDHEFITGKTANDDGNYAFPVRAVRLKNTVYASGSSTLTILQGG